MNPEETLRMFERLTDLKHEAERKSNRPGAKRNAAQREDDRQAARAANQRLQRFRDAVLGEGEGMRPAVDVIAEADALLEREGF